jgi:uncharacterized protein (TIGR00369 family)
MLVGRRRHKEVQVDDMLAMGQQVLAAQPFSTLLGAQLTAFAAGAAEITLALGPTLRQQHGFAHGGVISYAADNALTFAGGSALGPDVVTAEYKINYLRPAQGEWLIARATVIAAGRRQAVYRCDIFVEAGGVEQLCATAQGTSMPLGSGGQGDPEAAHG